MFKNMFSFEGRIRRTEYGISFIIYFIIAAIVNTIMQDGAAIIALAYIPMLCFFWAQGAKRCHDRGNSGWYQIIPFYALWMIFAEGDKGENNYGDDPKEENQHRFNDENAESDFKPNVIIEETNVSGISEERYMQKQNSDVIKEQMIDEEVVEKTFVPKRKPIRKIQS